MKTQEIYSSRISKISIKKLEEAGITNHYKEMPLPFQRRKMVSQAVAAKLITTGSTYIDGFGAMPTYIVAENLLY